VTRIDWGTARVTATTRMTALQVFNFLPSDEKRYNIGELVGICHSVQCLDCLIYLALILQTKAKLRLVVAAVVAGTDYCANVRGKSFGKSCASAASFEDVSKADVLLEKVSNL
jgi:CDP-diglyceride synthetase